MLAARLLRSSGQLQRQQQHNEPEVAEAQHQQQHQDSEPEEAQQPAQTEFEVAEEQAVQAWEAFSAAQQRYDDLVAQRNREAKGKAHLSVSC